MKPNLNAPLKATLAAITVLAGLVFANIGAAEQDASTSKNIVDNQAIDSANF